MPRPESEPRRRVSPHRTERQPHYRLSWTASARSDVVAFTAEQGTDIAGAALIAATDVEYGRRRGKALGDRNVTGNLSGLFRVKFDLAGNRPERFRLIYCHVGAELVEIVPGHSRPTDRLWRNAAGTSEPERQCGSWVRWCPRPRACGSDTC